MASTCVFLLLLVAELTRHNLVGGIISRNPQAMAATEGSNVTFSCEINITEVCNHDPPNTLIHINWWSSLVSSPLGHGGYGNSEIEITTMDSDEIRGCNNQIMNNSITVIASSKLNMSSFQCAVSIKRGSPCDIIDNKRMFSQSALLTVNTEVLPTTPTPVSTTPAPVSTVSTTTSTSLPTATSTPTPPDLDDLLRELQEKEFEIAQLRIELNNTEMELEEADIGRQEAEDRVEEAESINYSIGVLLGVVTILVLLVIIAFVVFAFKKTRTVKYEPPHYDSRPPMTDNTLEKLPA